MNKRKVLSILLLALITVTLAVSCSGSIDAPVQDAEELAYVTFGNGHSRGLSTSYETEPYNLLYWFYTAEKNDAYGTTGVTTDFTPVSKVGETHIQGLSGQVGPFSQGAWKFKLRAYGYTKTVEGTTTTYAIDSNKLVYESDVVSVTLKGNEVKNVPVSVTTQGDTGTLKVRNAYFEWYTNDDPALGAIGQGGGSSKPSIEIKLINKEGIDIASNITQIVFNDQSADGRFYLPNTLSFTVPKGYYTAQVSVYLKQNASGTDVKIDNKETPVFRQSFGVRIYGNAITYISGNMVEGVDSKVTFDVAEQEMILFTPDENGAASFSVAVTPSGTSETQVSFPNGALSSAVHQLNVEVTPIASANQRFQVYGTPENANNTAVAGIELKMVKVVEQGSSLTEEDVTSFNGQAVTVTTHIAPNLQQDSVSVKYLDEYGNLLGEGITVISYTPSNGLLVFKTTHFSQYVVIAPVEALNVSTGVPYTSLAYAIAAAGDGQEIQLKKDICLSSTINVEGKKIRLDLNGKTLTTGDTVPRFFNILNNSNVVITGNGTLSGLTDANAATQNQNSLIKVDHSTLTIENGTFTAGGVNGNGLYGIYVAEGGNLILGTSENGPTINTYFASVSSNNTTSPATIVVNSGSYTCISSVNVSGNSGNRDWECAAFYLPASGDYEFNGGTVSGSKYAISTPYKTVTQTIDITGGSYSGNVSAIFKGDKEGSNKTAPDNRRISITGGTFSSDPKAYVAEGYIIGSGNGEHIVSASLPILNGVYTISNADELIQFEKLVNIGKVSFSGKTVQLTRDVNLSGNTWTPVGQTGATQFLGTFDGQGHTISNLTVDNTDESEHCASGLFGWLNNATVKNINIAHASVTGHHNVGVIAGYLETSGCTIENCNVTNATVSCTSVNKDADGDKCGGIVGHAGNAGVEVNNCTVSNSTISAGRDAGQVVGAAKPANVTGCSASNVTVTSNGSSTGAYIRNEVIGRVL